MAIDCLARRAEPLAAPPPPTAGFLCRATIEAQAAALAAEAASLAAEIAALETDAAAGASRTHNLLAGYAAALRSTSARLADLARLGSPDLREIERLIAEASVVGVRLAADGSVLSAPGMPLLAEARRLEVLLHRLLGEIAAILARLSALRR